MTFIHNESCATIQVLKYIDGKWTYISSGVQITGHLKEIGIWDKTFNLENIAGKLYKMTCAWIQNIKESDKCEIDWQIYTIQAVKVSQGIHMKTTKILLVKWDYV